MAASTREPTHGRESWQFIQAEAVSRRGYAQALEGMQVPTFEVLEEPVADLRSHAAIPSVFETRSLFEIRRTKTGFELDEIPTASFIKNYDDYENPLTWPRDFDTRHWILLSAYLGAQRIGGAIVAYATAGVDMLEGRADLAVLWDLRVDTAYRRQSVASALIRAAQRWSRHAGCTELKIETQNTNPDACRLYLRHDFILTEARYGAYQDLPNDVQLIWRKRLKD